MERVRSIDESNEDKKKLIPIRSYFLTKFFIGFFQFSRFSAFSASRFKFPLQWVKKYWKIKEIEGKKYLPYCCSIDADITMRFRHSVSRE